MLFHQVGAVSQAPKEQVCAINISGVTRQCTTQSELAIAPILSGFCRMNLIVYLQRCNSVANIGISLLAIIEIIMIC